MYKLNQDKRSARNVIPGVSGFSLIELLVVLVILSLLGGIVGPRLLKHLGQAKSDTAALQIEDLSAALDVAHHLDSPLQAVIRRPSAGSQGRNGPPMARRGRSSAWPLSQGSPAATSAQSG